MAKRKFETEEIAVAAHPPVGDKLDETAAPADPPVRDKLDETAAPADPPVGAKLEETAAAAADPPVGAKLEETAAAAADPPVGAQLDVSTLGVAGLFRWPQHFAARLRALFPEGLREIQRKFQQGVFLSSSYSGVGSAEFACSLVEEATKGPHAGETQGCGLLRTRATDSSADCRKLLCCDGAKMSCVFGTLEERASPMLVEQLKTLQESYRSRANRDPRPQNQAFKIWGASFMKEAMDLIMKDAAESGLPAEAWCYKHNKACRFNNKLQGNKWSMEIAGVSCTDFSVLGNRYGWLGATAVPFLLWRRERLLFGERITVIENVESFDRDTLLVVFPQHSVTVFQISPNQFGVPASRTRKYCVLLAEGCCWSNAVKDRLYQAFEECFCSQHGWCNPVEFLSAPQTLVDRYHSYLAVQRGFPACQASGLAWKAKHVTKAGQLQRIREWERMVREAKGLGPREVYPVFMNATQNADRSPFALQIPALITNMQLWSMEKQRFFLTPELLEVQGFPMFQRESVPEEFMCPFRRVIFRDLEILESGSRVKNEGGSRDTPLTHAAVRRMAGNSMSMPCLGAVVMFTLAWTVHHAPNGEVDQLLPLQAS